MLLPLSARGKLSCEETSIFPHGWPYLGRSLLSFSSCCRQQALRVPMCEGDLPLHWVELVDEIHCSWTLALPDKMT